MLHFRTALGNLKDCNAQPLNCLGSCIKAAFLNKRLKLVCNYITYYMHNIRRNLKKKVQDFKVNRILR